MRCIFCGAVVDNEVSLLLPQELEHIFREGKKYGFRYTTLSGGEPLVYKYFREAVEIALKYSFWVNVTTNGLLINQDLINFLKCKNVNLRVSLHTLNPNKHCKITGTDTWNTVVNNIKLLKMNNMYFSIGCTIFDSNISEIEDIAQFAFKMGAAYIRFTPVVGVNMGMQYETDRDFYKDSISRITRLLLKYRKYIFYQKNKMFQSADLKREFVSMMTTRKCPAGSNLFMIVDSEHNVLPCQFVPKNEGWYQHCNELSFIQKDFSALHSLMEVNFDNSRNKEHKGECAKCDYVKTCLGGCLANRMPKNKIMEDEQDICMLSLLNEVLEETDPRDREFIIDYWMYYFNQRITKKDRNVYCMRKLPIWELNFRMDIPRDI